jgi:hypothetical protein
VSCDERRDAILLLSAGLLDGEEADALREHLRSGCPACARHAREARDLNDALLLGAPVVTPPARLREALEGVAQPVRGAPGSGAQSSTPVFRMLLAAGLGALLAGVPAMLWATRSGDERAASIAAAEKRAAELDAALVELRTEYEELIAERDELDAELGESGDELNDLSRSLEDARDQVAMLRSEDLQILAMNGTAAQPDARAKMFWNWDDYYCYMHVTGLAAEAEGAVYAVWIDTSKGGRILAGTLAPERGNAELWVQLPRDIGQALGALVTLESGELGQEPAGAVQLVSVAS